MRALRILILIVLFAVFGVTHAKGPASKITITGPELLEPIEITDANVLAPLSFGVLENSFKHVLAVPDSLGEGYELTRYFSDERGNYTPFDHVHYYPNPSGADGYVYYDGIINGSSEYDGDWFRINHNSELVLMGILSQYKVAESPDVVPSIELKGHTDALTTLVWSPDSQLLVSSAGWFDSNDKAARLWSVDGSLVAVLDQQTAPLISLSWSPDGKTLATGSWDGSVQLWNADGTPLRMFQTEDRGIPFGLSWSPDGKTLAVGSLIATYDNRVELRSVDGTLLKTLHTQYSGGKFLNVGWSPDGKYLVGGAIDYSEWLADGTSVFTHDSCEHCTPAWGFAWSHDSQMWAIGNESGKVWVYDLEGNLIGDLQNEGNVDVMAWSPDGTMLAGGNSLWKSTGTSFEHRITFASGRIASLTWSPDSTMIASSAYRPYISVSDIEGHVLTRFEGHNNSVQVLAWSPDGITLASGSVDHTVRLWDMSQQVSKVSLPTPVPVVTNCVPTYDDGLSPSYKPDMPVRSVVGHGHVLTGYVLSSVDCKPIPNAKLELWPEYAGLGHPDEARATLYTDADGKYRFECDLPEHIHMQISAPGYRTIANNSYHPDGKAEGEFIIVLIPQ